VRWPLTGAALIVALALQSALTLVLPRESGLFDPFLLVVVYCGLVFGETHGMLAGTAAGWIQDLQFGGAVSGLQPLTKMLVGFAVGVAATRFLIAAATTRFLVVFAATLLDALAFERFALVFDVPTSQVSASSLVARAVLNALAGSLLFQAVDARLRREARP
jgi:rod shape-determining protein MreD